MTVRALAWGLAHGQRWAVVDILRHFHIPFPFQWSPYWNDAKKFYVGLDLKGREVLDIGSDYGTTPMYFLNHGAMVVRGFSFDAPKFFHPDYLHYMYWDAKTIMQLFPSLYYSVLKMDCEGMEWDFTSEWISSFHDWIICLHAPIRNKELHKWIVRNGTYIGRQGKVEFAIYQKRRVSE